MQTVMAQTEYPVKTTSTSFRLVDALYELEGAGITELATHLDISKSAVHKHIHTMRKLGFIREEGDVFYPSLRFLDRGTQAQSRNPLYSVANREVENLASTTGEWVGLVTEERNWGVYLATANGSHSQNVDIREGSHFPLHEDPAGKAILAHESCERVRSILAARDAEFTSDLENELQRIKDQQLAYGTGAQDESLQCVAASIVPPDGTVVGSICVVGSAERLQGKRLKEEISGLVLSTARSIGNSYSRS